MIRPQISKDDVHEYVTRMSILHTVNESVTTPTITTTQAQFH